MRFSQFALGVALAASVLAQVKSREIEDLFSSDSLKPKASKPTAPAARPAPRAPAPRKNPAMRPTGHDPDRHLARRVGIKVRVQIASAEDCHEVDPSSVFHTGDRIRLLVEPNIDGYLYILQTGSSGKESMLFPHPDINDGQNEVMRGRLYSVPSSGSFTFRDPAGQEVLKVILSRTPLQSLPADAPSGNNVQLAMNSVNNELAARVRSRDLVYESETGPTRKGTPGVPTQAVIWLNTNPDDNNVVHFDLKLKHEAKRP